MFAAASLTGTFGDLEKKFEAANPGTDVVFNFAGSSALAQQINQGAPADVFASADQNNMTKVTDAGNAQGSPRSSPPTPCRSRSRRRTRSGSRRCRT